MGVGTRAARKAYETIASISRGGMLNKGLLRGGGGARATRGTAKSIPIGGIGTPIRKAGTAAAGGGGSVLTGRRGFYDKIGQATGRIGYDPSLKNMESYAGSFLRGAAAPAMKAAAAFGVSSGLGEIAEQTDNSFIGAAAGLGSFWAGTVGFRQALRAPIRGARAKFGYRNDMLGKSTRQLSRVYDRYMYAPERMAKRVLGAGGRGVAGSWFGVKTAAKSVHGAGGIGRAFIGGMADHLRFGRPILKAGQRAQRPLGVTNRLMNVRHPFLGAMGIGATMGAAGSMARHSGTKVADTSYAPAPSGGINPRNWGGGITMMNARGGVNYRMSATPQSMRMSRGRKY